MAHFIALGTTSLSINILQNPHLKHVSPCSQIKTYKVWILADKKDKVQISDQIKQDSTATKVLYSGAQTLLNDFLTAVSIGIRRY